MKDEGISNHLFMDKLQSMDELCRENKWKDRPKELYPDVSCKDAPVPPPLPVPNCECGKPSKVTQSMHPDTAAQVYYLCGDYRVSRFCVYWLHYNISWFECWMMNRNIYFGADIGHVLFFQWIDGPEMVDRRILLFRQCGKTPYDKFKRWVPPPPNPPSMTDEEKKIAIATHMANPPLCNCGVPAQIHRMVEGSPYTPTFECRNRTKVSDVI